MAADVLLVLGEDPAARKSLAACLAAEGREVHEAPAEEGLQALVRVKPDVLVMDAGRGALDQVSLLRSRGADVDAILLDGRADVTLRAKARKEGAFDVLDGGLGPEEVRAAADAALRARSIRQAVDPITASPLAPERRDGIVGRSAATIERLEQIVSAADTSQDVLVLGESGTGTELIARAVHECSRAGRPLVAVNMAAVPEHLAESELFGKVRGAFTGADQDAKGAFELAGRGTILLDEIGAASLVLQAKLLRVLQEKEFWPVGAQKPRRSEARVIAITNEDLEEKVERRLFRRDLYYRLKVLVIRATPLRERKEDILPLARHFVLKAAAENGYEGPFWFSPETEQALLAHPWRGNVRELENLAPGLLIRQRGGVILPEHLEFAPEEGGVDPSSSREQATEVHVSASRRDVGAPDRVGSTLAEAERAHILSTLRGCTSNVAEAARRLGLKRPTLYDRMRRLGISREDFDPPNKDEP